MEVDPPIPRGWVRHWRLTAKAKSRHDAQILEIILREIDNSRYHWRKSFVSGKRRIRKMIENTQNLRGVREHHWKRYGWPEDWKKYFQKSWVDVGKSDETCVYRICREDLFELFTERHYIRHVRVVDCEAESRLTELKQHLSADGRRCRLERLLDCRWRWDCDPRQKKLNRLAELRIRKALGGDWEAEVTRSFVFSPPLPVCLPFGPET